MRRWARPADWLLLAPTYALLLTGSLALYACRGRRDVFAGLLRGVAAGLQGRSGAPALTARSGATRGEPQSENN